MQPAVCVDDDLTISIKRGANRLSPGKALRIAEKGIRTPTRRMTGNLPAQRRRKGRLTSFILRGAPAVVIRISSV